jgi:hypothetical protein
VGTVLGLFGLALFVVCVMTLAAAMTWVVVKVIPASRDEHGERAAR